MARKVDNVRTHVIEPVQQVFGGGGRSILNIDQIPMESSPDGLLNIPNLYLSPQFHVGICSQIENPKTLRFWRRNRDIPHRGSGQSSDFAGMALLFLLSPRVCLLP